MATTTDLEKLVINYLTQDQYDDAREAGTLNANELYLTPDTGSTGGTVTSVAVTNGGALSVSGSPITTSGTITISHADTSSQSSVSNSGRTYIQSVTLDTYGHVTGLTSATETVTNTDEKLGTDAVTSGTTYYIIAGTNTTGAERKKYDASGIAYKATNGTANGTNGEALLTLGNSTASTSANWKAGKIFLYSSSAYGGTLVPEAVTSSSKTWTLPNKTGTIALTSDIPDTSSFITVDEKLKWTASTTSNTYYPIQSTSTAATSTANTLNGISFYQYYNTAGGYRRLDLGNATAWKSTGGAYGTIRLYGAAATYYGDLVPGVLGTTSGDGHLTANRTWTFPNASGTVALTSDIPTVPTKTSDLTNDGNGTSNFATMADIGSLGGGTITKVKTTAGTHTTIDISTGNAEFNVPTKTSHLTNDSGFVTSSGVTSIATTSPISGGTITSMGTISHATSGVGTAVTTAGFYKFKYDTYGHVTGVSSVTASDITGLVTIPTNTDENVKSTAVTAATTNYIVGSTTSTTTTGGLSKHASAVLYITADSGTSGYTQLRLGNTTATSSAGGKEGQIRLYGTNATYYLDLKPGAIASSNKTITFPNKTGTVALTSDIPDMSDYAGLDDLPTITLNGTATTSPSFYAPTTAGTSGYVLKSNGSGAPTWTSAVLTDTKVTQEPALSKNLNLLLSSDGPYTTETATYGVKYARYLLYNDGTVTLSIKNSTNNYITSINATLPTANRTISLPDATGTVALTADLANYLPLTGGDLSGNLRLNADSGVGRWVVTRQNDASVMSSGVGTGGIHGLFSDKGSRWMIQAPADGSSVTINEGDNSHTYIAGDLTVEGHSSPIGTVVTSDDVTIDNIASGGSLKVTDCSIDVTPGVWIVNYYARFPANTTGYRGVRLGIGTTSDITRSDIFCQASNSSSVTTRLAGSITQKLTTNRTYTLKIMQGSGSTMSGIVGGIVATRLA